MRRTLLLPFAVFTLLCMGCPKATGDTTLRGSEDEQMDAIGAQIEEYSSQPQTECSQKCTLRGKVCNLSKLACDIANRFGERADYQRRCVATQEECARYGEACSSCQ